MRWWPGVVLVAAACAGHPSAPDTVRVTIPNGAGLHVVAESLASHHLITSPWWFRTYATVTGHSRAIRAGIYDLPRHASTAAILHQLVLGTPATERLVIPEGLMLKEVAAEVQTQLGIPSDSLLAAARDSSLRAEVGTHDATLEGYLYPSTYRVRVGADARDVVRQMVHEFEMRWRPDWTAHLHTIGMTRDQIVTLASIIEGEVRYARDRKFVSSVYHNRLRRGMRLQADPTVIYALGRRRRLYEKDYQIRSRYNTYLHDGLPPGPIGEPSSASIEAALYPEPTDFLYFVARPDGQHIFSRTLRQHLEAVAAVRRMERRARRR